MRLKKVADILISLFVLMVCGLPMIFIGAWIALTSPGGVFYLSRRIGLNGRPFCLYKFRTMHKASDSHGSVNVKRSDPRITSVGKVLRKTKLDELPQLFNVLRGDMSLVGPRPDLQMYVDMYSEKERAKILSVKPGLTDWASLVNYHQHDFLMNTDDIDQAFLKYIRPIKVKLQLYYVDHRSIAEDFKILLYTAFKFIGIPLPLPMEIKDVLNT